MSQPLELLALVVDDEAPARSALRRLLATYCPTVTVVGEATEVPDALAQLQAQQANLLFLDITMPVYTGFELLEQLRRDDIATIFVTAHSEFALSAFRAQATDYLLKPIDPTELIRAVARAYEWLLGRWHTLHPAPQPEATPTGPTPPRRLALPHQHGHRLVQFDEVEAVVAQGAYATVVLTTGEEVMVSQPLAEVCRQLPETLFFQIHRSYAVHLAHVREVQRTDGGRVVMRSKRSYPVARARFAGLEGRLLG